MAEILRARGKLGPYPQAPAEDDPQPPPVSGPSEIDTAAVRAWAAANGIEIASRGPIPAAVAEMYRQAMEV